MTLTMTLTIKLEEKDAIIKEKASDYYLAA